MSHTYHAEKNGREYFAKASIDRLIGDLQNPYIRDELAKTAIHAEMLEQFATQAFTPDVSPEGVISIADPGNQQGVPLVALRQGEVLCRDTSFTAFTQHQYALRPEDQDALDRATDRAHHGTPEYEFNLSLPPRHVATTDVVNMKYIEANPEPQHSYDYFNFRPLALLTYRDSNFGPTSSAEMAYLGAKALHILSHPYLKGVLAGAYYVALEQAEEEHQRIAQIFKNELCY